MVTYLEQELTRASNHHTNHETESRQALLQGHPDGVDKNASNAFNVLGSVSFIPARLVDIEEACRYPERLSALDAVHFYRWDKIISRKKYTPEALQGTLPPGTCLLTKDYSMFRDMYPDEIRLNWQRAHEEAERMVQCGFKVIPSLSWAEEDTFQYCFDFIQPGGTIAVSTIGVMRDVWGSILFETGLKRAVQILHPSNVIVYGGKPKFDLMGTNILCFPNTSYQWTVNYQRKENK